MPAMIPTPAPTPTPTKIDQISTAAGSGDSAEIALAKPIPRPIPRTAPSVASVADSTRNWFRMSRRLGHGHEHDVHDHDGAYHETDGWQRNARDHHVVLDLVPELERGVRCLE